ncbi:MAG: hypothetical protein JWP91_2463 [Fibrobacteres bacterium]|nr:hypothetical protein [Fibrobacterota bacterium]
MAVVQAKGPNEGDGWRYLLNARHILDGYFAGPDTLMFWNGPGYPLFLAPFLALGIPMAVVRLANAVFLSLAVAHFQGALRLAGIEKRSLAYAYGMGLLLLLHGPLLGMVMTESLSAFLVCGAAWHYGAATRGGGRAGRHACLAGLHLGYLALTKVFFGYVLEAALPIAAGLWLWSVRGGRKRRGGIPEASGHPGPGGERRPGEIRRASGAAALACASGLLLCAPWLAHTWAKTGKANLWGNSGGFQLYFMSLPEREYFGDWINFEALLENPEYFRNHADFIRETLKLDYVAQDGVFKKEAIRNCREHPGKCILNWRANVNRMAFGFPNTYYPGSQTELATGNRAFVFAFPFMVCLLLAVPGWLGRRSVPPWVQGCLAFACLSLGGMSLVCAIPRQVFPLLPMLGLWCMAVVERALEIRIVARRS